MLLSCLFGFLVHIDIGRDSPAKTLEEPWIVSLPPPPTGFSLMTACSNVGQEVKWCRQEEGSFAFIHGVLDRTPSESLGWCGATGETTLNMEDERVGDASDRLLL